ncbi:clusterin-associated protein 1-like [Styela clava]
MSYRDLRNFTEMMRALGYPRMISIENFRTPNFPLVAEILLWLVQRYDPNVTLPTDTDTEQDRVIFIKSSSQFVATKAHIKLNTKRLYMADGYAVKELVKIASVLYSAMKSTHSSDGKENDSGDASSLSFDIDSKIQDLKAVRKLSTEITERGALLYDLLGKEIDLREARLTALAQPLEINEIEKGLRISIQSVEKEVQKTLHMLDNIASDEVNLEAKIAKRKTELERSQKRLKTLESVRPAFMDEFEQLEEDLKIQYESYLYKFRNMTHLEQQLEDLKGQEQMRMEETESTMKKMQDRLREEEKRTILSTVAMDQMEQDMDEGGSDLEDSMEGERPAYHQTSRPSRPPAGVGPRNNMYGDEGSDDDDDEETLSSSNLSVVDDNEDLTGDDSDDFLDDMAGERAIGAGGDPRRHHDVIDDDDGEF